MIIFHSISCLLYNSKTIRDFSMKHGTLIKHDAQESLLLLSYRYFPLIIFQTLSCPLYNLKTVRDISMKLGTLTWGDRKVRIKILSFLYLLLFRDEISSTNAAIYMQLIHCNNACIKMRTCVAAVVMETPPNVMRRNVTSKFYFYFKILLSSKYCNTRFDCVYPHFI